jgi:electron transfer flavoprotein alpha subunit
VHCCALSIDEKTNNLKQTRPAFGGGKMSDIITPKARPQIVTVSPNVFKAQKLQKDRNGEIIEFHFDRKNFKQKTQFIEFIESQNGKDYDISDAQVIVAGGRGVGKAEGFKLLEELAVLLGGKVAATRPPVDDGLVPHALQIGQTGKSVSPKIYAACALSGQIHHMIGIGKPDIIIAINKDSNCPAMQIANYALQGDIYEIIPEIIREIKLLRNNDL